MNQANSAFHPIVVGKWLVIHIISRIMGWRPLNGRPGQRTADWTQDQHTVLGLAYGLYAVRPICLWHNSAAAAVVAAFGDI